MNSGGQLQHEFRMNLRGALMNVEQLRLVVDEAGTITKEIRNNYPKLTCYPVFSYLAGQCDLTADIREILRKFPDMLHDSEEKSDAVTIIHMIAEIEAKLKQANEIKNATIRNNKIDSLKSNLQAQIPELNQLTDSLDIRGDIFIELRFEKPILEEVFRLQSDPIVSQRYTPQTKASVRIVLGTVADIYKPCMRRTE